MNSSNKILPTEKIDVILATDCGSTTSKARLFMKKGKEYRFVASGEAPTTVEAPFENVTLGVRNAVREIEELLDWKILTKAGIQTPAHKTKREGVDLYVTTSSAGGGLQMMVFGVVKNMTGESANRAALGAGAIVMDILTFDDARPNYKKIEIIRALRPDMILICGGTDGGTESHVAENIELVTTAQPEARFGGEFSLPIVYAGNNVLKEYVGEQLSKEYTLRVVDNVRPTLEIENPGPARDAIHEFFMEHVMAHAPGYPNLMKWTEVPIMPTPMGEGMMFQLIAKEQRVNLIGVGLGGATTNVYSIFDGKFVRTVSANLGMSYSICNVLKETGIENIIRWVPFDIDKASVTESLYNKMIRPTTIPRTLEDLAIEQAVAREAIRKGFEHHKDLARPLRGIRVDGLAGDLLTQDKLRKRMVESYIDTLQVNIIGGTGGLLSRAPRRAQSALILIDAFQPEGVTRLIQDSIFMMPHLGVLSTVHSKAAYEVFDKDCVVRVGTCIAARQLLEETETLAVTAKMPDGKTISEEVTPGNIKLIPLKEGEVAEVEIQPAKNHDVGAGFGQKLQTNVTGGVVGLIIDVRGRPLQVPTDEEERRKKLLEWFKALQAYPEEAIKKWT